jgi:hypothetical protein
MRTDDEPPPHDFPDQGIREQLEDPSNLRDLLTEVLGELAVGFVCEEREILKREFPLEDWRHRESDLLFRIPYRTAAETVPVFVCVLVEHQSQPDPRMPLRTLVYAVLYWEREWKTWEGLAPPRPPLRLTPVVPIVLHTGKTPWRRHRELVELMGGPEPMRKFAPSWQPLFLDLGGKTAAELLQAAGKWLNALAVVQADRDDTQAFSAVLQEAMRRLEGLAEEDRARWRDLLRFVLMWAIYRRPPEERDLLVESARASQTNVARQREVQAMSQTIAQSLRAEGKAEGKAEGQLQEARRILQDLLTQKFRKLPEALLARIDETSDVERLHIAIQGVLRMETLDELQL